MRIERVVVNSSPLICLFAGGFSELLPSLFTEIIVPGQVYSEVTAKGDVDLVSRTLLSRSWVKKIDDIAVAPSVLSWDLGRGESAVVSYALLNENFWAIIDDREARRCAASLSCRYMGTVGAIVLAKKRGVVQSVRDSLRHIRDAGLWVSEDFVEEICKKVNE